MSHESVATLIVGGGQAGLAMSHMLSRRSRPHLVLERGRVAERWRSERWDGLRFQFPNWSVQLPDLPFPYSDPDGFATRDEILKYIEAYALFVAAPIRCGVVVTALRRRADTGSFVAETSDGTITADNVVVATGPYQKAIVPDLATDANLFQVHASRYTNPDQLPPGAVLVVGSGASGAQIAEELLRAGRRVYLSIGQHRRFPRRYRGRDLMWWLTTLRLDQTPVEKRGPSRLLPLITGAYGGHTIDLRDYAARGITPLGRLMSADDGVLHFAADLAKDIENGDQPYYEFLDMVDDYLERRGLEMPHDPAAHARLPIPPELVRAPTHLDVGAAQLGAMIWATGYGLDYSWIDLPAFNEQGEPIHRRGVSDIPGLYFIGLQWLSKMTSSFLSGVGDDAAQLADHIAARG